MLLSLRDGALSKQATFGEDPLAVALSADGRTAYFADNRPGDVHALSLPRLEPLWKTHVGGSPSGLLFSGDRLYVSLWSVAQVAELDGTTGALQRKIDVPALPGALLLRGGEVVVACGSGKLADLHGHSWTAGTGFGVAVAGGSTWTEDYERAELVRLDPPLRTGMPVSAAPFWLQAGGPHELLVSAEGSPEDDAPGAVVSFDTLTMRSTVLARSRDPDMVLRRGDRVFVAAHGDHEVQVITPRGILHWALGAEAVALAIDEPLGLLVVAVDASE